jgi:hypothetical protein
MKDDLARQVFTLETEIETLKKELE